MDLPTVSVIIPTVDRPTVRAAVMSALNQTCLPLEVIVVVDRSDGCVLQALNELRDKIKVVFSGGVGPSGARMYASLEANGEIIAFLDDDDTWFPEKLERQLSMWPEGNAKKHTLISSRAVTIGPGGEVLRTVPTRLIAPGERVASYLFRRSSIKYWEGAMHPSTLICDRDLLTVEPWDPSLLLHEDWDWVLRVGARHDVEILMSPDVLTGMAIGDMKSLSRSADWRPSFSWLKRCAQQFTPRELGDFVLGHTAVIAIRFGDRRASLRLAGYALTKGRPGLYSWLVWLLNLISPALVDRGSNALARASRKDRGVVSAVERMWRPE